MQYSSLRTVAIIVAAGQGARAGGALAKQYQPIAGKPMLWYSMEALLTHPAIAAVQVVIHPQHGALYQESVALLQKSPQTQKLLPPVFGGEQRSDSVRAGMAALGVHTPDRVLIHDAARPFLSHAVIDGILAALTSDVAVVPALALHDTVRRLSDHRWSDVAREGLWRIQTPQAFPFAAFSAVINRAGNATDDAALWLAAGHQLIYSNGDESLRKVTTATDIAWAEQNIPTRSAVGMGFDVHALVPSGDRGTIRLGGIDIPCEYRLHGHSDADVLLHATVDALLGAIADGDIGQHFPPTDARWKGADSALFVTETLKKLRARGGMIQHLDLTLIGEVPKVSPHREAIRTRVAQLLEMPVAHVSMKATTTERLGFTGREEGIAAQAIATVVVPR